MRTKDTPPRRTFVLEPRVPRTDEPPLHPATRHFARKFRELLLCAKAQDLETGRRRDAKCTSVAEALKTRCPGKVVGLSKTNLYRFLDEEATPNIDQLYEIARVFQVSPREFLPEEVVD